MMISPEMYIEQLKDAEYLELIEERNDLIEFIKDYEKKETVGDRSGDDWLVNPSPDVRYQMYLEYLGELCKLMQEKYNTEYVWGDRRLQDDAKNRK